jgi:type IV pilus assembly protein PilY1
VFVGTGRYLGSTDLADSSQQSVYAIKDTLGATSWGNPRLSTPAFVQQSLTSGTCAANSPICTAGETIRTASSNAVDFAVNGGWYVDLPGTRERANTDPQLAAGTLAVTTNLLNPSACTVGGSSFINYFDYRTGSAVQTAGGVLSVSLGDALATRPVVVRLESGEMFDIISQSDNTLVNRRRPPPPPGASTRRTSWRELTAR